MDLYERLRRMRMLLVEDDKLLREAIFVFFKSKGCDIRHVPDAEEALALLDREMFGIVISDHWLPGASGLTLLRRVGEQQPGVLRVLITASPTTGIATGAMMEGVDGFILKPFTGEELESALTGALRKEKGTDACRNSLRLPEKLPGCP